MNITLEAVQEAYKVSGLIPKKGFCLQRTNGVLCGCAIGALYVAEYGIPSIDDEDNALDVSQIYYVFESKYGYRYITGFLAGFDRQYTGVQNNEQQQGYDDGFKISGVIFDDNK